MDDDLDEDAADGSGADGDALGDRSELVRRQAARDEVLIEVLAQGASYSDAAKTAGCSSRTIGRRMADPTFRGRVDERRSEWVSQTSAGLTALGPVAVEVLRVLLINEEPSIRLRSAREILLQGFRSRQLHDLELDVREIRAQLEQLRTASR